MTIKRTFATYTILASLVMVAISGTTQSVYAQMFGPDAIPKDADVLLVEIIDGSTSIDNVEFQIEINGLIDGLQKTYDALQGDPDQNLYGESYVVVIQFSSTAQTECTQEVDTPADLTALQNCIAGITQIGTATCISCGFNEAVTQLAGVPAEFMDPVEDRQIIDIVTDGGPFPETQADAIAGFNNAVNAGYDRIVALGIVPANSAFLSQVIYPLNNPPAVVLTAPFNSADLPDNTVTFPDGYVILVDDFTEFAEAIEFKLVATIVDPCTLPNPPLDCVGGEFLPVDSTALLIAGMSANLSLIVPIAAGIAGAGAYLIRSRMSKD